MVLALRAQSPGAVVTTRSGDRPIEGMSKAVPPDRMPPGHRQGDFVPLQPEESRLAYATLLQSIAGMLPPDPTFPREYQDAASGEVRPMDDTPMARAVYAAGKLFDNDAKRVSFYFRAYTVMPIVQQERKYEKHWDRQTGTVSFALLTAVAAMRCNARLTKKALRQILDESFRMTRATLEPPDGPAKH